MCCKDLSELYVLKRLESTDSQKELFSELSKIDYVDIISLHKEDNKHVMEVLIKNNNGRRN
ncbi:MAG: hypothetical protein ACRC92_24130 [Peptostreptococcaceae bacterium]